MKNNFITKIIGATLAFAMMIGGAVGINAAKEAKMVDASTAWTAHTGAITAGNEYLIVRVDGNKSMNPKNSTASGSETTNAGNYSQSDFSAQSGPDRGFIFADAGNSKFYIKDGTCFVRANGTTNNGLASAADNDTNPNYGIWTVTETSTAGQYTIINANSRQISAYQSSNWRSYGDNSGSKTNVKLYEKAAAIAVESVSVSPTEVSLGVGATQQLTPTVLPANALNKNVSYSSGNTNIATVSASGLITAVAAGNTTITVTTEDGGFTASCAVTVTAPVNVTGVSLNKSSTTIEAGNTETLVATVLPNDASNKTVNWSSSDEDVATVSEGVVTAVGSGTATITATTVDGGYSASCEVTVTVPSSVTFVAGTDIGESTSLIKQGVTISVSGGTLNRDDNYRVYSGETLTISSSIGNISTISLSFSSNSYTGGFSSNYSNILNSSWTSAEANGQARITQIVVGIQPTTPTVELDKTSISLKTNESAGKQVTATVYNVDNPAFIWTPANGNNVTVEVNSTEGNTQTVTIKPNTNVAVDTSVTLTIQNTSLSATVEVHITVPEPGETPQTAYTVAQAKAAIAAADSDIANVYIRGTISQIDEITTTAIYWISDDGTTADQFKIYRGKFTNESNFSSDDQIMVGDVVIVYGTISKQYTNLNSGNYIYSITLAPRIHSITLNPSAITVEADSNGNVVDLFTSITINQDDGSNKTSNDIVWTSDDDDVLLVDDNQYVACNTHRASTIIRASIGGREYGHATVTILRANTHVMNYTLPEEWTVVADPSTLTVGDRVILTGVKAEVTYAAGTYSSGNNVPADTEHPLTVVGNNVTGVQNNMIYTLVAGTVEGSVAFKDSAGKYLYAASSSSNYMRTQDDVDANASFILNSNGTVVAQGTASRNSMRYNNTSTSNLFSCYASDSSTGDLVTFYKLSGGTAELDLFNLASIREAHEDANGAYVKLGVSLSQEDWATMDSAFGIAGYGVMVIREATLETTGFDSIEELYNSESENKTKLSNLAKNSETAPQDFSVEAKINITNESNRSVVFCAATYVKSSSGAIYFINETRGSLAGLL